jgi:hypothetical protein
MHARAESEGRVCRRVAGARALLLLLAACRRGGLLKGGRGFPCACVCVCVCVCACVRACFVLSLCVCFALVVVCTHPRTHSHTYRKLLEVFLDLIGGGRGHPLRITVLVYNVGTNTLEKVRLRQKVTCHPKLHLCVQNETKLKKK